MYVLYSPGIRLLLSLNNNKLDGIVEMKYNYIKEIQSLRGISIFLVFLYIIN